MYTFESGHIYLFTYIYVARMLNIEDSVCKYRQWGHKNQNCIPTVILKDQAYSDHLDIACSVKLIR